MTGQNYWQQEKIKKEQKKEMVKETEHDMGVCSG